MKKTKSNTQKVKKTIKKGKIQRKFINSQIHNIIIFIRTINIYRK